MPRRRSEAFVDGWLRTGDVGYVDPDGYVFLVDRIKDLIISSGFNIYPRTIEEALMAHPAVDEANVIGVPDEYRGETAVAFVKLKPGQADRRERTAQGHRRPAQQARNAARNHLQGAIAATLIGKLSKKELREEYKAMKGAGQ